MQTHKRTQCEDSSTGNILRHRSWSHDLDDEDEVASENALLNEANEPRFAHERTNELAQAALSKLFTDRRDYALDDYREHY
ncbi:hypothetical protein EAI_17324 [Harpegnathos saltator]|uniref:Uncharacterized protein n=1 Tax=Harpegnathos saltator TaxID=610380 RepID=E2BH62_HARSA|nr:hypothetical protein EAI_17324 [Harpegnathos saltator]